MCPVQCRHFACIFPHCFTHCVATKMWKQHLFFIPWRTFWTPEEKELLEAEWPCPTTVEGCGGWCWSQKSPGPMKSYEEPGIWLEEFQVESRLARMQPKKIFGSLLADGWSSALDILITAGGLFDGNWKETMPMKCIWFQSPAASWCRRASIWTFEQRSENVWGCTGCCTAF